MHQDGERADCGQDLLLGQIKGDHIRPWREAGTATNDNLQMPCRQCSFWKGTK